MILLRPCMFCIHSGALLHVHGCCCMHRVRVDRSGGAWCPKQAISRNVYEWIEVDLQELKAVTQIETQGRHANGQVACLGLYIYIYILRPSQCWSPLIWRAPMVRITRAT